jgi:RNA polymerase sigma factor (TIGR02999 family)
MSAAAESQITRLLLAVGLGEDNAEEELLTVLYDELRVMAAGHMKDGPPGQTLQPTALVNEAYLRLLGGERVSWENRRHFFFVAARAMHDILVEQARRKCAKKRGGDWKRVDPESLRLAIEAPADDMLALSEALEQLEREKPEMAQLVHLRFFAGLTEKETAAVLEVTERTVQRRWRLVRLQLFKKLATETASEAHE